MNTRRIALIALATAITVGGTASAAGACAPGTTATAAAAAPARRQAPPPPPRGGGQQNGGTTTPTTTPAPAITNGTVAISFTGGHTYEAADKGRPSYLYDGALGLPMGTYRTAFQGVTPAHGSGPSEAEAQANKAALMSVLAPFGVTNERLDQVANRYRFQPQSGQIWAHRVAAGTATVVNGKVTAITITDPGYGYNVAPTVIVNGQKATATLGWSADFGQNGRITAVTL